MLRDIRYDFKRTFLGTFTLISDLMIILISVGVAYLVVARGVSQETALTLAQQSFSIFGAVSGDLIAVLAVLSSYFYFGKDKANDVLESVIALPVTRSRLIGTRYLANVSSMLLAFVIGTGFYELILYEQIGMVLAPQYLLFLIWVFLVEVASFTGLVYLASQFLRTQGGILGFAIALFMIFGIFWSVDIPLLILYFMNLTAGTNAYVQNQLILQAISPIGYSRIAAFLIAPSNGAGVVLNAAQFGITELSVGLVGLLWTIIPISLALYIGKRRD